MEGKWANQIEWLNKLLALRPNDLVARFRLAEALANLGRHPEAIAEFQRVLASGPQTALAWWRIAESLRELDRFDESLAAALRSAELDPNSDSGWHNVAWALMQMGRPREAIPYLNRALQLAPNRPLLIWRRAWIQLILGQFENGWRDCEARWLHEELQLLDRPAYPGPAWRGEDIRGKSIFVYSEQGIGDTLQFCRYLPLVKQRGAAHVIFQCAPSIAPLLARSMPEIELLPDEPTSISYDFHVAVGSLPLAFGTTLTSIPAKVPYLFADAPKVERWRQRLAGLPGMKVGLVWSGNPEFVGNRFRAPPLQRFAPIGQIEGITLVSLQKGSPAQQISSVPQLKLVDWTGELNSFDDTAALATALDLTVTVDTSVAHLVGALGLPAWVLLGAGADFRWLLDREDSPWYPTLRLFRQTRIGDWDTPIVKIASALVAQASCR